MINEEMKTAAIATNLETLEKVLYEAKAHSSEAVAAIRRGEKNEAIGATLCIEEMLRQAMALYGAAIAIHRI